MSQIKEVLLTFPEYWEEDTLLKSKVIEDVRAYRTDLIEALFSNEKVKKAYSLKIGDGFVFKTDEFISVLRFKNYWENSYTKFSNEIGLTSDRRYLKYNTDVVIDFPHKDCVLEGGMTKGDVGKNEIYYHKILAKEEIDTLFAPKVFTNIKKYDENGEHEATEFSDTNNLIIKGNNLLALSSLSKRYKGKIKCICIDPPYNTGNDEFNYNDNFNQSTWLTFMKNRLEMAKDLLASDGTIAIYIDSKELAYLQVLLDEIFGRENFAGLITVKRGSVTGHKTINPGVVNLSDYILLYSKDKTKWTCNRVYRARDRNIRYNNFILNRSKDSSQWEFCSLLDAFSEYEGISKNQLQKKLGNGFESALMNFVINNADSVIQFAYPDESKVSKETQDLIKKSKTNPDKVYIQKRDKEKDIVLKNGQRILFYSDRLMEIDGELVTAELVSDIWDDVLPNDLAGEGGVKFRKGKKPEKAIRRILQLLTNPGDIVLDFFMGSGTTCAVALKMHRKFIGIEQMDYIHDITVNRLKKVVSGKDEKGITKLYDWQGGGSFIYTELHTLNMNYVDKIEQAQNDDDLEKVILQVNESAFLNFKADFEKVSTKNNTFAALSLEEKKRILIETLDMNQLYLSYSEIDDLQYNIPESVKKFNRSFYEEGGDEIE